MKDKDLSLSFFALRNQAGDWYRRKGFSGYGKSWTPDLDKARIYTKIGAARGQVTYWAGNYPEHGVPEIVEFEAKMLLLHDETGRVNKTLVEGKIRKLKQRINHRNKTRDSNKLMNDNDKAEVARLEGELENL